MKNPPHISTIVFNVMGQGWYVETPVGNKGPFTLREAADHYAAALAVAFDGVATMTDEQLELVESCMVIEPSYAGFDRRIAERRSVQDRRSRIRFEVLRYPRRGENERRETADS